MAASDFTYAGNGVFPGTSSQHFSIPENITVHPDDYGDGVYDSPPSGDTPDGNGYYHPTMPDGFAGTGSAGRELRNAPHPAASQGHSQYHILNMAQFQNLEDTAISMRATIRNNANKGGKLVLFAYADLSELMAFNALPEWVPGNNGEMQGTSLPGIYAIISGTDGSMSVQAGYHDLKKFDTYNPIHQMPDFPDYFGYNKIGDWTSIRFDIIPWADTSGVKYVRFRLFQALRNYHPLSEDAWQDYTRVSATDPSPSSVQDQANKISMVEGDRTYDQVFNDPHPTTNLAGNPINGTGAVCGFGMNDAWNYPGSDILGYGRIGVTNFEVRILDQGI
jgi:hypothetical protein